MAMIGHRKVLRAVAGRLPFKRPLVELGVRLPPFLKGGAAIRFFSFFLYRLADRAAAVSTNLGFRSGFHVRLPLDAHPVYLFGRPSDYRGEIGPLKLANHLLARCDAFIDVGAYLGYYIYYLSFFHPDKIFHYFEPNPKQFTWIEENVRTLGLGGVNGHEAAMGASEGEGIFHFDESEPLQSSLVGLPPDHQGTSATVRTTTLDRFMAETRLKGPCIVKVDVENAEHLFVEGGPRSLHTVAYLILELLGPARGAKIMDLLIGRFGFQCYYINRFTLEHMDCEDERYSDGEYNFLFCRERPEQLADLLRGTEFRVATPQPTGNSQGAGLPGP